MELYQYFQPQQFFCPLGMVETACSKNGKNIIGKKIGLKVEMHGDGGWGVRGIKLIVLEIRKNILLALKF